MGTPSYDIKNKGDDMQEEPKVKLHHEKGGDEKEKIIEKETPSQDINNKDTISSYVLRDDTQEIPKMEHEEGGYVKEKIVEKETISQYIIKIEGDDDAQEKLKVEYEEEEYEKEKIVEKETPSQDINNKGDDAQEKPKVEHEEGDDKETPSQDIIKMEGEGALEITKVVCEKIIVREDLAVQSKPPSKRDPPKMQTDNNKL
ncbi:systemin isoform 2 [Solanum lycopersicum]|uniref:Systemin n=1 Tax=Solanum lycopersicum TaxID=4081 RepID=SYST_SOLLC|nr:systemin isoform 2 [Solanum lycopersicum]P27058.1 RecName: Full=Systemin; Flags: Precursor [Solanum lycopersicum]AAA34182.1 prosystemin [Solanum lycopersicum]AAA34184.1 prosystemin [Solanum lycopersicum]